MFLYRSPESFNWRYRFLNVLTHTGTNNSLPMPCNGVFLLHLQSCGISLPAGTGVTDAKPPGHDWLMWHTDCWHVDLSWKRTAIWFGFKAKTSVHCSDSPCYICRTASWAFSACVVFLCWLGCSISFLKGSQAWALCNTFPFHYRGSFCCCLADAKHFIAEDSSLQTSFVF